MTQYILHVMHRDDMVRVHPRTDYTYSCDNCWATVGIYPSGQKLIKEYGRINMKIICNRCQMPTIVPPPSLDVLREVAESIPHASHSD